MMFSLYSNGKLYPFKLLLSLKESEDFVFYTFCQDDVLDTITLMIEHTKKLPRALADKLNASAPGEMLTVYALGYFEAK